MLSGSSVFMMNSSNKIIASLGIQSNSTGVIELRDAAGNVTLHLDGGTGIVTSNGTPITVP
jgi:hypothetical protein